MDILSSCINLNNKVNNDYENLCLGIDFGTTNSCLSVWYKNKININNVVVTNPPSAFNKNPVGEEPNKINDGNIYTKWLDRTAKFGPSSVSALIFDFGENYRDYDRIMYYDFITANDMDNRDPKTWFFAGSNDTNDKKKWDLLDDQINQKRTREWM